VAGYQTACERVGFPHLLCIPPNNGRVEAEFMRPARKLVSSSSALPGAFGGIYRIDPWPAGFPGNTARSAGGSSPIRRDRGVRILLSSLMRLRTPDWSGSRRTP
jgi:hypothetical protein